MFQEYIEVHDATQNNLKHVSLRIPKHAITVVTGVSGSGKSSLVLDTIAAQARRELNDTFPAYAQRYLPSYARPHVGRVDNLPCAIVVDQKKPSGQVRSTVGTYTDIYTLLRLLFSRVGTPFVGYSDTFSFNHPQGRCPRCDGLGEVTEINVHRLVDFDKCLDDPGVINYVAFEPGQWRWLYYGACGLFDTSKKIRDYTPEELQLFLYQEPMKLKNPPAAYYKTATYEGLMYRMNRMLRRDDARVHWKRLEPLVDRMVCPDCQGTRLAPQVLACKIEGFNIAEVTHMPLGDVVSWLDTISNPMAADMLVALRSRLDALIDIGLAYLTLDRPMGTLSGGEAQRCKIAKYNNSSLSDLLYVLDEPSAGLHGHDIARLAQAVQNLRDRGNTVLMVEHNRAMIQLADHIVDMGPAAGANGGQVLFEGDYPSFLMSETPTGRALRTSTDCKKDVRTPSGWYELDHLTLHNLKDVQVRLPRGVLCGICGVAGSGKSSLMDAFAACYSDDVVLVSQQAAGASLRSTPATYMDVAGDIRKLFARSTGQKASLFSFNAEGACPVCQGKGVIVSEMAFMDSIETPCEACGGLRYAPEVLQYRVDGLTIADVMDLSVGEACDRFPSTRIAKKLGPLVDVGLSYIHLNQALSTLSGGELQRMKLASYLGDPGRTLVLDEPTCGLHPQDVRALIDLFDRLVDRGDSLFVIDHDLEVLKASDYVIEVGPGGGEDGGRIIYAGLPADLTACPDSVTAPYLARSLGTRAR